MIDFEYHAPESLEQALALLDQHKGNAVPLAGGTDLLVQMKHGRVSPAVLIDVKKIPELQRLEWIDDKGLFVGAAVPASKIANFTPMASRYGFLCYACSLIGSFQLRSRATMGGNVCNGTPSADSAPSLLCLEAQAVIAGSGGSRILPLTDFFTGPGQTALAPAELLVGFEIPIPPEHSGGSYLRHTPREEMDIAVTGVASFLVLSPETGRCREARIALGAVAPIPVRALRAESFLVGAELNRRTFEEAAALAAECARPISDIRGSAAYRRELVRVLTKRTLAEALGRIA